MSGVEKLARVLQDYGNDSRPTTQAERILADPGPLLEALAEAGVLQDRSRVRTAMVYDGDTPVDCVLVTERQYVTEWRPTDARA